MVLLYSMPVIDLGPNYGGGNEDNGDLPQKIPCMHCYTQCPQPCSKVKVKSLSHVQLFATPWTVAHQTPLSMGFSRQEYWSGLPFPSPGDLPNPGIKPRSPTLQVDASTSEPPGKQPYSRPPPTHANPRLCWKLLETHRQVWVSLLCGNTDPPINRKLD